MKKSTVGTVLSLLIAVSAFAQAPAPVKKHQVVFQMNTEGTDSWRQLLGNIGNVQKVFGAENVKIVVVTYGKGISLLLKTDKEFEEQINKAVATGVVMSVCQNTMRMRKVSTEDLLPVATQVDSGVAELIRRQESGFAYIRAGL